MSEEKKGRSSRRKMLALGPSLGRRLEEFRERLQACRRLEVYLGMVFPGHDRISLNDTLDWLLLTSMGDLIALERRLLREQSRRGGPTDLDTPPPAA